MWWLFVWSAAARCDDGNNMCEFWAANGECSKNPDYMGSVCKRSCGQCEVTVDMAGEAVMEEAKNPLAVAPTSASGGLVLTVTHAYEDIEAVELVWLDDGRASGEKEVRMFDLKYGESTQLNTFLNHVFSWRSQDKELARFRVMPDRPRVELNRRMSELFAGRACVDKNPTCVERAARGECTSSPGWMVMMCAKSCDSCHLRDPATRCARQALNMAQQPTLRAGDLDAAFVGAVLAHNATVHSGPRVAYPDLVPDDALDGPWVVTFDDFLSRDEADDIIASVEARFSRSTDQGNVDEFGEQQKVVSQGRTSENAWCVGKCESISSTRAVIARIQNVTGVPEANYESFQVLRYMPGQFYRAHHDMSPTDNKLACGPRIYTFFLYLSDVDDGGETEFPTLRDSAGTPLRIRPKKGTALWWPSVTNADPTKQDFRTRHAALPVKQGVKFAANAWIHQYDYSEPNKWGCTGAFD